MKGGTLTDDPPIQEIEDKWKHPLVMMHLLRDSLARVSIEVGRSSQDRDQAMVIGRAREHAPVSVTDDLRLKCICSLAIYTQPMSRTPVRATMCTFDSPIGTMAAAVEESGSLLYLSFLYDESNPVERALLRDGCVIEESDAPFAALRHQLDAYWNGSPDGFDLPLAAGGTAFQQRVWNLLRAIPIGETRTYGQLAGTLESPNAARAVGRANATNPIAVVVPCHRVIGSTGGLTGFAGGIERKRWLLSHEQKIAHRYH